MKISSRIFRADRAFRAPVNWGTSRAEEVKISVRLSHEFSPPNPDGSLSAEVTLRVSNHAAAGTRQGRDRTYFPLALDRLVDTANFIYLCRPIGL